MSSSILGVLVLVLFAPLAQGQKNEGAYRQQGFPCSPGATNLCIPLDGTFQVVRFDGDGGNGEADPMDPCQRNDDDISLALPLQFTFDLYGQSFTEVFVNNNGNVSFGQGFSTFTSTGFPVLGFPMVAPFWGDVDTRALESGVVYFRSEPHRFTVIWDHVGYFGQNFDKLNTFELILSDGTDPLVGLGNNVCFCYDDMQWTTGDASSGVGGFGGVPATVGVNAGNGVDFFQIGRFDQPGIAYDGPGGLSDGVDFLDGLRTCFSVGADVNQPPIFVDAPMDCLPATPGVPLNFTIRAISPESAQVTTIMVDDGGLANFGFTATPGNPAEVQCTFTPGMGQVGNFVVGFMACDDFDPVACTSIEVCLSVGGLDCFTLNFDTEDDFTTPLVNGQHVDTEFGRLVTLGSAGANAGLGIFASAIGGPNDPSQDPDLLIGTGNVLILQTENLPPDGDDVFPRPNDDSDGGTLRFDFRGPVMASSLRLVDADVDGAANTVVLTDLGGLRRTYTVPMNWTGDRTLAEPGQGSLDLTTLMPQPGYLSIATAAEDAGFDPMGVVRLEVNLAGSGGVDDVSWCQAVPVDEFQAHAQRRNGSGVNPTTLASWTLPLVGGDWVASMDCRAHGSGLAWLVFFDQAIPGLATPYGEVLVGGTRLLRYARTHVGSVEYFSTPIPFDLALSGIRVHAQGVCTGLPGPRISNALEIVVGF